MIGRYCGPVAVYMGRTRIILFSVTSGSHMKDQVADHIGGSALRVRDRELSVGLR